MTHDQPDLEIPTKEPAALETMEKLLDNALGALLANWLSMEAVGT